MSKKKRVHEWLLERRPILPPAALILTTVFFFTPAVIYVGNRAEMDILFTDIVRFNAVPASLSFLFLLFVGFLVPGRRLTIYTSLLSSLGIMIWVQGNLMVWSYGLLDGQGIDWTIGAWRGWVDASVWISAVAAAAVFHRRIWKPLSRVCLILICLQAVHFCISHYPHIGAPAEKTTAASTNRSPPEEVFQFSSDKNVIHIVLDSFQSDFFRDIVAEDPDYYGNELEGFTLFEEATGSYPTTIMSVPAIVSGVNYRNDVPMGEFISRTLEGKTIWNVLYDKGFGVDLVYPGRLYFKGRYSNAFNLVTPYGVHRGHYLRSGSAMVMDIVLFRCAPHFLKRRIYNDQLWLLRQYVGKNDPNAHVPFSHQAFFRDMIENMSKERRAPVYKYIHLNITHSPVVMTDDCDYAGRILPRSRDNLVIQDRCALNQFIEFLRELKRHDIYDGSLIILQADHGAGGEIGMKSSTDSPAGARHLGAMAGLALPLVAIKRPHRNGPMETSTAQVMLSDTAATIGAVLDLDDSFPGRSMFDIDPTRKRKRIFYNYKWRHERWGADFFPRLDEYHIEGSVFDRQSWRLARIHFSENASFQTDAIDFGTEQGADFLLSGWGGKEFIEDEGVAVTWGLGKSATVLLTLPREGARLIARVKPLVSEKPQRIAIFVDDRMIGRWKLENKWEWQERSIDVDPAPDRPKVSHITFEFSHYRKTTSKQKRPLAVLFDSLTVTPRPTNR